MVTKCGERDINAVPLLNEGIVFYILITIMISMEIDIMNPYVARITIAARPVDTINAIAKRIGLSYGWTHKWVNKLAECGVFRTTRMNVYLNEKNTFYQNTLAYIRRFKDVQFHYEVLQWMGIAYCFTKTDAVYVWTKGGYNIGRNKYYYPIFIKLKKQDLSLFQFYCKKLNLEYKRKNKVFYNIEVLEDFKFERCDEIPVDGLDDTIAFMKKYVYNFQPALEMIQEMYEKQIGVKYKEVITNV